jgi:acyl-CoA thioesterase-1
VADPIFKYIALGDSTGVGVGAASGGGYPERLYQRLKLHGFPAGILNLAQSGATTRDVLYGQIQKATSKQAALVTLGIGTNDLWRLIPAGTFRSNLKMIADGLEKTGAQVIVSNIIDLAHAPVAVMVETLLGIPVRGFQTRIDEFNDAIQQLSRRERFTVVDLYGFSRKELPAHPEYFAADGFHPSAAGYEAWTELLWPKVEAVARAWRDASPAATGS